MGFFEDSKKEEMRKSAPFYRVETVDGNQCDYEPGSTVEAVEVGHEAHYVVKGAGSRVIGMHPFESVLCVRLIEDEDYEEE
jgi:hypothetical protein